ncbi:MAG: OmpA family protein [Blastocatellales bacterium]
MKKILIGLLFCGLVLIPGYGVMAQDDKIDQSQILKVPAGTKKKLEGVIISREPDSFILRDQTGSDYTVALTGSTKVEEKKGNPFRGAKKYGVTQLLRGLTVEVEGRGDSEGALVADKVKFKDDALVMAKTVETRMTPVEGRVSKSEERISQVETNAERISGQIAELQEVSNAAKGGAKAAQETADAAVEGVVATNKRIDQLVSSLDDYQEKKIIMVNFKVNSAKLSPEAMETLDEIAAQAKVEKAYMIEVTGYASSDGNTEYNRRLSRQRADAVVQYLAENHMIPLRRIITPFGYGELNPVADNETRDGREQNRRVEVRVLVNKGLTAPPPAVEMRRPGSTGSEQ